MSETTGKKPKAGSSNFGSKGWFIILISIVYFYLSTAVTSDGLNVINNYLVGKFSVSMSSLTIFATAGGWLTLVSIPPVSYTHLDVYKRQGMASFGIKFDQDTEIIGYMKLHLFIECRGHDNMDLFVFIKKYNAEGTYIPIDCMGFDYRGAWGQSRASRRELDLSESTDYQPVMAHQKDEPLEQGKVYELDVEIHPHARIWHKGEELRVEITPEFIKTDWYEDHGMNFYTDNGPEGTKHVIHTGGEYPSYLQIPTIPPKDVYKRQCLCMLMSDKLQLINRKIIVCNKCIIISKILHRRIKI